MSTSQSAQRCEFVDLAYYQQQQQQAIQVSPQHIQRLRHLQQQAALQQQPGYPQQQVLAMPHYQPQHSQMYQQQVQSTLDSTDALDITPTNKESKRAEHNAIERARREHLNTKFQQLAHSLPNLQNDRRPSKGTIIERTLEFVKHTVQKEERYKNEIKELSRANRQLMRQVTSRSSFLVDSNCSHSGDDDDVVSARYQEDDIMDNTSSDESISRKSSCSSFAMQSMSTANGTSSTTTSPSLDYQSAFSLWDKSPPQQQEQEQYYYQQQVQQQQQLGMYLLTDDLMNDNYLLSDGTVFNLMKSPMDIMNNNVHIKYEPSSFS